MVAIRLHHITTLYYTEATTCPSLNDAGGRQGHLHSLTDEMPSIVTTTAKVRIKNTATRLEMRRESIFFNMVSGKMTNTRVAICQNSLSRGGRGSSRHPTSTLATSPRTCERNSPPGNRKAHHHTRITTRVPSVHDVDTNLVHNGVEHIADDIHISNACAQLLENNAA